MFHPPSGSEVLLSQFVYIFFILFVDHRKRLRVLPLVLIYLFLFLVQARVTSGVVLIVVVSNLF